MAPRPRDPTATRRRPLPAAVAALERRIQRWRDTRSKRTRMPEPLWTAAVEAAAEHGLWAVSRALRVNYEALKARLGRRTPVEAARFVEIPCGGPSPPIHGTTVVELCARDGSRVVFRLGPHDRVDVSALVREFQAGDR